MERLFLEILDYHRENLITEKRVNDIVLVAMENNGTRFARTPR